MSEFIASMARPANPRPLADIVAEDRAIEMLAQTYADMACTPARKSHAVGKDAYFRSVAAALERASEIVRSRIAKADSA